MMQDEKEKDVKTQKEIKFLVPKPPRNWKGVMSREVKRYRNKWNTEHKPYKPTPKGDPSKREEKK